MTPRIFEHTDYDTVYTWWIKRGWKAPPLNMLPKTGFIVDKVAACFLYSTDSDICVFELTISNPESKQKERDEALDGLIDMTSKYAQALGYKAMLTYTSHPKFMDRLEKHMFHKTDENMTHFVRRFE